MLPPYSTVKMETLSFSETSISAIRPHGVTTQETKIWKVTVVKSFVSSMPLVLMQLKKREA
jgi:hypothetical protein